MGRCPKCKKEIDELDNWYSGEARRCFSLDHKGRPEYTPSLDFEENGRTNDFECKFCAEVIAKTEEKAIEILRRK